MIPGGSNLFGRYVLNFTIAIEIRGISALHGRNNAIAELNVKVLLQCSFKITGGHIAVKPRRADENKRIADLFGNDIVQEFFCVGHFVRADDVVDRAECAVQIVVHVILLFFRVTVRKINIQFFCDFRTCLLSGKRDALVLQLHDFSLFCAILDI